MKTADFSCRNVMLINIYKCYVYVFIFTIKKMKVKINDNYLNVILL